MPERRIPVEWWSRSLADARWQMFGREEMPERELLPLGMIAAIQACRRLHGGPPDDWQYGFRVLETSVDKQRQV